MRRLLALGVVLALAAAACGGSSDDTSTETTTSDQDATTPADTASGPDGDVDVDEPDTAAAPDPTATTAPEPTATPEPEPVVVNAIAIGLDPEPLFDFTGEPSPDGDISATLIVGSPLKVVVTSQYGFPPGCFGLTIWDALFVALIEGYLALSIGGCDSMAATMFPNAAILFDGDYSKVLQLGEMPTVALISEGQRSRRQGNLQWPPSGPVAAR